MPDDFGGAAPQVAQQQQTPPGGGSAGAAASVPAPQPAPVTATPAPQPLTGGAAAAAQTPAPGVLDQLRAAGIEGNWGSEQQALQYLAGLHRQLPELRQYAGYGQQYLQHRQEFDEFLRHRQAQQQARQAQQQQWWTAPEYDPSWTSKVYRDPNTGELRALPGNDPTIVQKLMAWSEHQRSFLDRFAQDPVKAIAPGLQQLVRQEAQALIQQHLGGFQERTAARQIVEQHADWIYERGADGQPLRDPQTGRPVLNDWGQRYAHHVAMLEQQGVQSVQAQDQIALGLVRGEYAAWAARQAQAQQQQQTQPVNPANERFLAQAAGAQHRPSAAQPAGVAGTPSAQQAAAGGPRGLQDLLMHNMRAAGYQPGQVITG